MGVSSRMFSRQVPQPGIQAYILPQPAGQSYVSSRMPFSSRVSEYVLKCRPAGRTAAQNQMDVSDKFLTAGQQHKTSNRQTDT